MFEHIPLTLAQNDTTPAGGGDPVPGQTTDQGTTGADGAPAGDGNGAPPGPGGLFGGSMGIFPLLMIMFVVMIVFSMRGSSREKKKRARLIAALKKGDRVQTVGGILGTIVQVRDADVVLKVDENTGAKISFSRSAVQNVVAEKED